MSGIYSYDYLLEKLKEHQKAIRNRDDYDPVEHRTYTSDEIDNMDSTELSKLFAEFFNSGDLRLEDF